MKQCLTMHSTIGLLSKIYNIVLHSLLHGLKAAFLFAVFLPTLQIIGWLIVFCGLGERCENFVWAWEKRNEARLQSHFKSRDAKLW